MSTAKELVEAAKLVVNYQYGVDDVMALAEHVLATVREDDDELLSDSRAWLDAISDFREDEASSLGFGPLHTWMWNSHRFSVFESNGRFMVWHAWLKAGVCRISSRRDLRDAARLLGFTLKDDAR